MSIQATFTPIKGVFGELFGVEFIYSEGATPDLVITVSNGTMVTLTIATTGGIANLQWDQMATQFNADSSVNTLATMVGQTSKTVPLTNDVTASPGFAGDGLSQFYSAPAPGPPPPVRPSRLCTTL